MKQLGYKQGKHIILYLLKKIVLKKYKILIIVYVDDTVMIGDNELAMQNLKETLD